MDLTEDELIQKAQLFNCIKSMEILKEKYDKTYHWCEDCDGLVCKLKDCCYNQLNNFNEDCKDFR